MQVKKDTLLINLPVRWSIRASGVCRASNLITIKDLLVYFKNHGTFQNVRNCGKKTEKELIKICRRYQSIIYEEELNAEINDFISTNYDIDGKDSALLDSQLAELPDKLSVRALNVCGRIGIKVLGELLEYYRTHKTFSNIQNSGQKTELELIELCKKYIAYSVDKSSNSQQETCEEKVLSAYNALTPFKKSILSKQFVYLLENLKVRARNAILALLGDRPLDKDFFQIVYDLHFQFRNLRNIGTATVNELYEFKLNLGDFVLLLTEVDDDELIVESIRWNIKALFKDFSNKVILDESEFFDLKKLKLFKLLKSLVDHEAVFKRVEREVFKSCYQHNSLRQIEDLHIYLELSKERVRQIKVKFQQELQEQFSFLNAFSLSQILHYDADPEKKYILIDDEFSGKINQKEQTAFTKDLFATVFQILLNKTHSSLKVKNIELKSFYLIKRSLYECFDFENFINNVQAIYCEKKSSLYELYFEGYVYQFLTTQTEETDSILNLCEVILFNEFDLVVHNGYLSFPINTKLNLHELIYSVLDKHGEFMTLSDIAETINNIYSKDYIEEQIRSIVIRNKTEYIYIGRSSTWGLRKWEGENIKGGTIRDIAEEFLLSFDEPKHIREIADYVLKFRDTTEYNVSRNIVLEETGRFISYGSNFYGLKSKIYRTETLAKIKKTVGGLFTKKVLEGFTGKSIDYVINYYVNKYGYKPVQVEYILDLKIQNEEIKLDASNKIIYE